MHSVSPILGPVVALVCWTLLMQLWMGSTRLPAMRRKGISLRRYVGGRPGDLDGVIEDKVQWKAHNYNHLLEQPTLFYAIALSLALMQADGRIELIFAWAYLAIRIAHSLVQAIVNVVLYRFLLFVLGTVALIGLTARSAAVLIQVL